MDEEAPPVVKVRAILELIGTPKEHVEGALKKKFDEQKEGGLKVTKEEFFPAKQREEDKLFTTFVEFEAEFKDAQRLLDYCFDHLPSTIEILEPDSFHLENTLLANLLNDMLAKLAEVDRMVSYIKHRYDFLDKSTVAVLRNFIYHLCGQGPQTTETMAKVIGIKPNELQAFVDKLLKVGSIEERDGKYYQAK